MGLFSWCTSDTRKSIAVEMNGYPDCPKKVYLLNPFGKPYVENDYDGYGNFEGRDVYALVAQWNFPELCKDENGEWYADEEIRDIGIDYSCYDRDHVKLKYPIKIVEKECSYEDAAISPSCPYQGYFYEEDMSEVEKAFHNLDKEVAKWKREQARKKQEERLK